MTSTFVFVTPVLLALIVGTVTLIERRRNKSRRKRPPDVNELGDQRMDEHG